MIGEHDRTRVGWPAIKQACEIYNNEKHRSTGLSPNEALSSEAARGKILQKIFDRNLKAIEQSVQPKYRVGALVRIKDEHLENAFAKSSLPRYTRERYKVIGIKRTKPLPSYELKTLDDIILPGSFLQSWLH